MDSGAQEPSEAQRKDTSTPDAAEVGTTVSDEHALLMREISDRAQDVLREADEGRWPESQLRELVNYLQLEGLEHISNEEWLLFRSAYHASDDLARLRLDHLELRLAIDVLTQAAAGRGDLSPVQLAAHVRGLLAQIEEHLVAEEQILTASGAQVPATTTLGARPHEWYALTEGPVIDLDRLPGKDGFDAVWDRLIRMKPGDEVELMGRTDPGPIWQRLTRVNPGSYGAEALERGPGQWRLRITRRNAR